MFIVFFLQKKLHELNAESESLSGEITQRKVLLEKIKGEDKDVTKVLSQNYGNF